MSAPENQPQNAAPQHGLFSSLSRRFQPWAGAFLAAVIVVTLLFFRYPFKFATRHTTIPQDFNVYIQAWSAVSLGGNPYNATEYLAYKYSPGFLALIGLLPADPSDAWFAFSTVSILALGAALMVGARYRSWKDVVLMAMGVVLAWKGILECLDFGQIEILLMALVVFAASAFPRFTLLSGALVGILPWIKLPLGFMVVPFVLAASRRGVEADGKPPLRRLKLFFSGFMLSTVFWGAGLPSLIFGSERALYLSQEWMNLLKQQPKMLFTNDFNQSVWSTMDRWMGAHSTLGLGIAAIVLGLLLALLVMRRPHAPASQDGFSWVTPWLIFAQLLNPLSWRWGSVYLVGAGFSAARPGRKWLWLRGLLWLALIALFLLQQNPFVKNVLGLAHWTDLHSFGVITLYWFVLILLAL